MALGHFASDAWSATIHVKIVVDEEEVTREQLWQHRLGARLKSASDVIAQHCDLSFAVTTFETWDSDDRITDLSKSLREFEQEIDPRPADMVIGFTSQYRFRRGRNSLGGTRGPLHSHILIRESAPTVFEPDQMEVLVHELGHFLGAAHSPHPHSVMRPILGNGLARARSFRIAFDPENARVIALVAREVRDLRVRRFGHLSPDTMHQIRVQYAKLAARPPKGDKTARRYITFIDRALRPRPY